MCFIINTECACGCYAFVSEHKCTPPCPAEDPKVIRTVVLAHDCRRPGHCPRVDAYWAWMFNNQLASAEHWQEYVKLAESKKLNEMDRLEVLSTWHYADAVRSPPEQQAPFLRHSVDQGYPNSLKPTRMPRAMCWQTSFRPQYHLPRQPRISYLYLVRLQMPYTRIEHLWAPP